MKHANLKSLSLLASDILMRILIGLWVVVDVMRGHSHKPQDRQTNDVKDIILSLGYKTTRRYSQHQFSLHFLSL